MPEPPDEDFDEPTWICTFGHIQSFEDCTCPATDGLRRVNLNINDGHIDSLGCAVCGRRIPGVTPLNVNASGFSMTLTLRPDYGEGEWWELSEPGAYEYRATRGNQ